jgi:hypothetical protein
LIVSEEFLKYLKAFTLSEQDTNKKRIEINKNRFLNKKVIDYPIF